MIFSARLNTDVRLVFWKIEIEINYVIKTNVFFLKNICKTNKIET